MVAGATLARQGWKVVVLEAAGHSGGTASTFRRGDYRFPRGPLGFSSPATVKEIWEGLCGMPLETQRVSYLLNAFGREIALSSPLSQLEEILHEAFPGESEVIREFFSSVRTVSGALREPQQNEARTLAENAFLTSARDFLKRLGAGEQLRRILGSQGCREPYSSVALLAAMWDLLCEQGIHYPTCGLDRLCEGLIETVRSGSPGGHLMTNNRVIGISVEGGRVVGVELENGDRLRASTVICNADIRRTYLEMLPKNEVPALWLQAVASIPLSSSVFQVAVGLNASLADLSIFRHSSRVIFCLGEWGDPADGGIGPLIAPLKPSSEVELCLFSRDEPNAAPPGGAVLVIRTSSTWKDFQWYRPEPQRRKPGYLRFKMILARMLRAAASRFIPGLEEAEVSLDASTPLTFADLAGRSEGAVAGWSWDFRESHPGWLDLIRTPIGGLYMCGHQAYTSMLKGGVPSAMLSGREAARAAMRGDPPLLDPPFDAPT